MCVWKVESEMEQNRERGKGPREGLREKCAAEKELEGRERGGVPPGPRVVKARAALLRLLTLGAACVFHEPQLPLV